LPSADDPASLLILRRTSAISLLMLRQTGYIIDVDYPIETNLKKNPASGKAVRYAQADLKLPSRCKN
jgi:hypothetical protein